MPREQWRALRQPSLRWEKGPLGHHPQPHFPDAGHYGWGPRKVSDAADRGRNRYTDECVETVLFRLGQLYYFYDRITANGRSRVYRARQRQGSARVEKCVRVVHTSQDADLLEVRVMSRLGFHPHIVPLECFYRVHCGVALVYPAFPEDTPPYRDVPAIRQFMLQLMDALTHVHARGVVHRDIKMSNLLWDGETQLLRLIDFNLSVPVASSTERMVGTEGFMAPEIRGRGSLRTQPFTGKMDVWSAGVVFWQLLTGTREGDVPYLKPVWHERRNMPSLLCMARNKRARKRRIPKGPEFTLLRQMLSLEHERPTAREVREQMAQFGWTRSARPLPTSSGGFRTTRTRNSKSRSASSRTRARLSRGFPVNTRAKSCGGSKPAHTSSPWPTTPKPSHSIFPTTFVADSLLAAKRSSEKPPLPA